MRQGDQTRLPLTFSIDTKSLSDGSYRLSTRQIVAATPVEVFPFFENPRNLSDITPPWLDFKIIDSETLPRPFPGARYEYSIRWCGIRIHWQSEIVDHSPPHRFTDAQLKGPYALWHHLHLFEAVADGTLLRDAVTYRLPLGLLGKMVHGLTVKRQLQDIFRYRAISIDKWVCGAFGQKQSVRQSS